MADHDAEDPLAHGRMTIWEHLAELRSRLIRSVIAVTLGAVVAWMLWDPLLAFLSAPYQELEGRDLTVFDPLAGFSIRLQVSLYGGIVLAMPVLLWQVWRFVTPGLYPHEKRYAIPFVVSSMVLFVFGAAVAYFTLNAALQFLIGVAGESVEPFFTVDSYVRLIAYMMLAFGIGMEFPVLLVALQLVGVLRPRQLLSFWRQAIVIIAVVAAVITPSGDPISMAALGLPMVLLYFVSAGIGALLLRRRRVSTAAPAT